MPKIRRDRGYVQSPRDEPKPRCDEPMHAASAYGSARAHAVLRAAQRVVIRMGALIFSGKHPAFGTEATCVQVPAAPT